MITFKNGDGKTLFHFAAFPFTAVDWFLCACQSLDFDMVDTAQAQEYASMGFTESCKEAIKISLVRHPCSYIVDYYNANIHSISIPLEAYVSNRIHSFPSSVGKEFDSLAADVCLRVEDLPWAFLELIESLGIQQDKVKMFKNFPMQVNVPNHRGAISPTLYKQLCESERDFMERYNYW
jgi:hypothetical protein